jgi:uncharacterized membrane protein
MSKFVVAIFPDEARAYEATRALKELDAEGSLTLYGMAVVAKDAGGNVSLKQEADSGPLGTAVGALAGGLVGLLGGPVGAAVGLAGGTMLGSLADVFSLGVGSGFVDEVSQKLTPGKTAVVAEVDEEWVTPLDTRMDALGGIVLRQWRTDVEDEQFEQEVSALKAELAQLRAEDAHARAETRAKLKARTDETRAKLRNAADRAQTWIDQRRQETEAKVKALQSRATQADAEARAKREQRSADLRADYERRSAKLKQALALTKDALTS